MLVWRLNPLKRVMGILILEGRGRSSKPPTSLNPLKRVMGILMLFEGFEPKTSKIFVSIP